MYRAAEVDWSSEKWTYYVKSRKCQVVANKTQEQEEYHVQSIACFQNGWIGITISRLIFLAYCIP